MWLTLPAAGAVACADADADAVLQCIYARHEGLHNCMHMAEAAYMPLQQATTPHAAVLLHNTSNNTVVGGAATALLL